MMNNYELVCVIDAGLSSTDILTLREKIEELIFIKEIDDMGLLPLAYSLHGQDQAYFLSYHIEIDSKSINKIKTELKLMKGLSKHVFYSMKPEEKFMKFSDLQKKYEVLLTQEEERLNQSLEKKDN